MTTPINGVIPGTVEGGILVQQSPSGAGTGGTPVAGADATDNALTAPMQYTRLSVFNGTTWDRVRSAVVTVTSTLTGFLNVLPWAVFNTAPTTRTNGQGGPLQADASGNLKAVEQYAPVAEDNAIGVIRVEHRYTNARVTASGATNAIKSGAGLIHSISVDKWVTGLVIDVYDALTVTGTPIKKITLSATDTGPLPASILDITFSVGMTLNLSAAADVGISYR